MSVATSYDDLPAAIRSIRTESEDALAERARARTTFDQDKSPLAAEGYHRADAYWLGLTRALQITEALWERHCIRIATAASLGRDE